MSTKKKYIDLQLMASQIKETVAELKQLDEGQIEQLKNLLKDETQQANHVSDEFSEYATILEQTLAPEDTLNAKINLDSSPQKKLIENLKKENLSLDKFVTDYIQNYLCSIPDPEASADFDYMAIVDMGESDCDDVSVNHDYYFGEALAKQHLR